MLELLVREADFLVDEEAQQVLESMDKDEAAVMRADAVLKVWAAGREPASRCLADLIARGAPSPGTRRREGGGGGEAALLLLRRRA